MRTAFNKADPAASPGDIATRIVRLCAASLAVMAVLCGAPRPTRADTTNAVYHGRDLGLSFKEAVAQVQATGGSQAPHLSLSISGTGQLLMFTEVNFGTIETETVAAADLDFSEIDVRKIGQAAGRYGITLRAAEGSVNDHVVGGPDGKADGSGHDNALSYMDFWLVDPDMARIRHLADLFATMRARLAQQPPSRAAIVADAAPDAAGALASKARAVVEQAPDDSDADSMPVVLPAPRVPVTIADDEDAPAPDIHAVAGNGKCLLRAGKMSRHGRSKAVVEGWSSLRQSVATGNGRLTYRLSAQHGGTAQQAIEFTLGNQLPVPATVIARVILTSSNGSQQAEDIGLDAIPGRAAKTDASLHIVPFDDGSCITDVDVSELHACPMPDDGDADESGDIYRCSADAAAGTTTVNGIVYVKGREPKMLTAPGARADITRASSVTEGGDR